MPLHWLKLVIYDTAGEATNYTAPCEDKFKFKMSTCRQRFLCLLLCLKFQLYSDYRALLNADPLISCYNKFLFHLKER